MARFSSAFDAKLIGSIRLATTSEEIAVSGRRRERKEGGGRGRREGGEGGRRRKEGEGGGRGRRERNIQNYLQDQVRPHYTHTHTHTHTFHVVRHPIFNLDFHEQHRQWKRLVMLVTEWNVAEPGTNGIHREESLTNHLTVVIEYNYS